MRRVLIIFMLILMPVQLSWAAVASYCEHEVRVSEAHLGHHEHQHQKDVEFHSVGDNGLSDSDDIGSKGIAPGDTDLDCGHCHTYCSAMLSTPPDAPGAFSAARPGIARDEGGASRAPTQPDRPRWRSLA